jgi:hypothetical protein
MAAARLIAVGRADLNEVTRAELARLADDMRAFGASEAQVRAAQRKFERGAADPVFLVHADNTIAVQLFMALATQWRVITLSTWAKASTLRMGLDYAVVEATARLEGLVVGPNDFRRLRVMEAEALKAFHEAAA